MSGPGLVHSVSVGPTQDAAKDVGPLYPPGPLPAEGHKVPSSCGVDELNAPIVWFVNVHVRMGKYDWLNG
jgi:hypothetical protein